MRHTKPTAALVLLVLTAGWCAQAVGQDLLSPSAMARDLEMRLPELPWHLADIWWQLEAPTLDFQSVSVDITVDRDVPEACNLYIAPIGIAQINGMNFYGGLQSNINGWASKESRRRVHPGKGAIFSRWASEEGESIGLDSVRVASDGLCESADYEGEFCSVRRPFAWTKGTYTYSIVKGDAEMVEGKPHTWFHCQVRDHQTGETIYIGSLRFEGETFTYWSKHAAFVEIYSTSRIRRSPIPRVKVTFGFPRINGRRLALQRAWVDHNAQGSAASPPCATAHVEGDSVVVTVGDMFPRDEKDARYWLDLKREAEAAEKSP